MTAINRHLERALIETHYALGEFRLNASSCQEPARDEVKEAIISALRTAQIALNLAVERSKALSSERARDAI